MRLGLLHHDSYAARTALLSGEACLDSAIPEGRPPGADQPVPAIRNSEWPVFRHLFQKRRFRFSGVETASRRAMPLAHFPLQRFSLTDMQNIAGCPGLPMAWREIISLSRVPDLAHFPSDAFFGLVLRYTITRYGVLRGQ